MSKTYLFLAVLLILLGAGLVVLEGVPNDEQVPPDKILLELHENNRYITTDQLADRLIEGDPTVQLIDVRKKHTAHRPAHRRIQRDP